MNSVADDLIRPEILNALHWRLAVPRNRVKIDVRRGHVTQTGVGDRAYSKACAERDACAIAYAVDVTDEIVVAQCLPGTADQRPREIEIRWKLR